MPKVNYYLDTFNYFKALHPSIDQGTVLDYGSNYGMFLDSSRGRFIQSSYTGVDVDADAISLGKKHFPKANFIFYNGFNHMYNPGGISCRPELSQKFDTIVSYSVLTHTTIEDTEETLSWLYSHLNVGGKLLATWLSVDNKEAIDFFYDKRVKQFGRCDQIHTDDYIYLVDNKISKTPNNGLLLVFYRKNYLSQLLSKYDHELVTAPPNIRHCFQDCIIINKS